MSWFTEKTKPKIKSTTEKKPLQADVDTWFKCDECHEVSARPDFEKNLSVCLKCSMHYRIGAKERITLLVDEGTFKELDSNLMSTDPLQFKDSTAKYKERLVKSQKKLKLSEAILTGEAKINNIPVQLGAFDFKYMGGSMGAVVGEKVTRLFERATRKNQPAIVVCSSGGARMQEGIISLMQMAKTTLAISRLKAKGLCYISVLADPTTGGVAASFGLLGDIIIAEPKALIGFAGPRVIEQTIHQKLPEGFQRAEFLLNHGMIDMIVERKKMRQTISSIIRIVS